MNRRIEGIIIIGVAVIGFLVMFFFLGLDTPILLFFVALIVLGIGISVVVDGNKAVTKSKSSRPDDAIVDSKTLHKEMNEERKRHGKSGMEAINTIGGVSTNNLARKDKSWNSLPDFFIKMAKNKDK